jgi:hypothetical protein
MGDNHSGFQHTAHAESVYAHVVADGTKVLYAAADERVDEVLWDSAEAEAAEHEGSAVRDVGDGGVCGFDYFFQLAVSNFRFQAVNGEGYATREAKASRWAETRKED